MQNPFRKTGTSHGGPIVDQTPPTTESRANLIRSVWDESEIKRPLAPSRFTQQGNFTTTQTYLKKNGEK